MHILNVGVMLLCGPVRCVKKIGPTKTGSGFSDTEAVRSRNLIENKHESDGEARQEINIRASNEGYTKVREDFAITEKAPTS